MLATVDISRIYLNEDSPSVLTCRHCSVPQPIHMSQYLHEALSRELVQIRCQECASIFYVRFDCRRYPRIAVDLLGTLRQLHPQQVLVQVKIISLSMGGVGFIIPNNITIHIGEVFDIQFVLNDAHRSMMHEEITIRRIQGPVVGAEFTHQEQYKYELDFYLSAHGGACA